MQRDMREAGAGDGVGAGTGAWDGIGAGVWGEGTRASRAFNRASRYRKPRFCGAAGTGGLGGKERGDNCPLEGGRSTQCTRFRRGAGAGERREAEGGREEGMGVGGVTGDGKGDGEAEGMEGGVTHPAQGHLGPERVIRGKSGAGRR